jgi:hypothetical protein
VKVGPGTTRLPRALKKPWPPRPHHRDGAGIQNGPLGVLGVLLVLTSAMLTVWFRRLSVCEELARDNAKIGAEAGR